MRKSATDPLSRRYEPALVSLVKQDRLVLHKCTTRYSRSSMNALQHEDGGAGSMRRPHGRPLSHTRPGRHRRHGGGALLVRENKMIACAACGAALRNLSGNAAVLGNEGSGWLAPTGQSHGPPSGPCDWHLPQAVRRRARSLRCSQRGYMRKVNLL